MLSLVVVADWVDVWTEDSLEVVADCVLLDRLVVDFDEDDDRLLRLLLVVVADCVLLDRLLVLTEVVVADCVLLDRLVVEAVELDEYDIVLVDFDDVLDVDALDSDVDFVDELRELALLELVELDVDRDDVDELESVD